jgi:hypothetical protein
MEDIEKQLVEELDNYAKELAKESAEKLKNWIRNNHTKTGQLANSVRSDNLEVKSLDYINYLHDLEKTIDNITEEN